MAEPDVVHKSIELERRGRGTYTARNVRGGELNFGMGEDDDFTPVELLLTAIAGCSAIDVDLITGKRAEPIEFSMSSEGDQVRDEHGRRIASVDITFRVRFGEGAAGDAAREALPIAVERSHDRLCTVTRTVITSAPVTSHIE